MGFLKSLVWTCFFIGVGVMLATYPVEGGRTPLQHLERLWKAHGGGLGAIQQRMGDAVEDAKDRLSNTATKPHEHHSDEDRDALNKLIARRTTPLRN